jgi:hypothetical protein
MMAVQLDHADLYFERDDVLGKEAVLEAALLVVPGVRGARILRNHERRTETAEVGLRVDFDPQVTNPVILEEALARRGFTVLSAAERP